MRTSQSIARVLTERRALVWTVMVALAALCVAILLTRIEIDSDVINMLPRGFESVEGLKIYNRDFEQTRELTFALRCQPQDVDKLEEFAPIFADKLRHQPWCERVLAGSPMESPEGIRDLQSIAVPLLLNLAPAAFEQTMSVLQPQKIQDRLHRLRQEIEAGSPRPEFELGFDPLGVIGPALKPFAEANAIEQEQPLASTDRTMRLFLAVTNQQSLSAFECQRLMREVNAFRAQAGEGWNGGALDVLVTGRSAYVAEISLSMRYDIVATLASSVFLVGLVFFVGFRRWIPLFGMGFSLLLSCLVALAVGLLVFGQLSMVAVGFCAILVGLGVDFAILIFGRYQQARIDGEGYEQAIATSVAKLGRAVFFGALTTAVGFLALILSGSTGFSQLGVLIAIGIFFAGLFMCTILFLFIKPAQPPQQHDWVFELVKRYVRWSVGHPWPLLVFSGAIFVVVSAIGFSPIPPLRFEASVRSLEPRNSRASQALRAIMEKMPTRWEPVLAIVRAHDPQELHDDWQKISQHWAELQRAGKLKGFSTPAALCLSPAWMEKNRQSLGKVDFEIVRESLQETLDAEGFSRDSFAAGFKLIDDLQTVANPGAPLPDWRKQLPKGAGWWFLVDRYFAKDPLLTTGFAMTPEPITAHSQSEELGRVLSVPGVPMILSGWSYALAELQPWSHRQLLMISALMAIFDISLLAILYRDFRLWLIQVITLAFGIGAMIATMKLLNIHLNLLNVLSFRLVLAIGVDYGIYVVLVWQKTRELEHDVAGVIKPVILAGLTAVSGFASLGWAHNPSLSGLGIACAIGIFWSLIATIFFTLPAMAIARPKIWSETNPPRTIYDRHRSMRSRFLLLLVVLLPSIAAAQALTQPDLKELLARVRERRMSSPDVHANFQEQKTIHLLNKPLVSSGKIWFHAPNKFRREVGGNSPSVTVSNGRDLWIYYANFKSAEHYTLGKRSPVDAVIAAINTALNLDNVENTFQISGMKAGSDYELQLLPRSPSMKRMFQRFDLRLNSDLAVDRTDMIQPSGDRVVTIYSNLTHARIPESTFEFTPPAGTEVTSPLGR